MLLELGANYTQGFLRRHPKSLQGLLNNSASSCLRPHFGNPLLTRFSSLFPSARLQLPTEERSHVRKRPGMFR